MLLGMSVQSFALLRSAHWGLQKSDLLNAKDSPSDPNMPLLHVPLQPLTALMGPNNSGKSAWFRCLSFFCDCLRYGVTRAATLEGRGAFALLQSSGTNEPMRMEFVFQLEVEGRPALFAYFLEISANPQGKPQITRESLERLVPEDTGAESVPHWTPPFSWPAHRCVPRLQRDAEAWHIFEDGDTGMRISPLSRRQGGVDPDVPALSLLGRLGIHEDWTRVYSYCTHWFLLSLDEWSKKPHASSLHVQTQSHLLAQGIGAHRHIDPDGGNLTNVLQHMRHEHPEEFAALVQRIGQQIPLTRQFYQELARGTGRTADVRLFVQYLLFADPAPRPLLYLDLPETGLYPERLQHLAQEMRRYTLRTGTQLLINTHSSVLLESLNPLEVWAVHTEEQPHEEDAFWSLEEVMPLDAPETQGRSAQVHCVGSDPLVRSLYREGVGMGALWYSGYLGETE